MARAVQLDHVRVDEPERDARLALEGLRVLREDLLDDHARAHLLAEVDRATATTVEGVQVVKVDLVRRQEPVINLHVRQLLDALAGSVGDARLDGRVAHAVARHLKIEARELLDVFRATRKLVDLVVG